MHDPSNPEPEHKCNSCRFALALVPVNLEYRECHRHAPIVTGGMMSNVETCWPHVKPDDWCGDFEHKAAQQSGDVVAMIAAYQQIKPCLDLATAE